MSGTLKIKREKPLTDRLLSAALNYKLVKDQIFSKAKSQVLKQTNGLYPAPLKVNMVFLTFLVGLNEFSSTLFSLFALQILQVLRTTLDEGSQAGYAAENQGFGELAVSKESRGLIGLFHGQNECKKSRFGKPERSAK